jgi:hypothetical protein
MAGSILERGLGGQRLDDFWSKIWRDTWVRHTLDGKLDEKNPSVTKTSSIGLQSSFTNCSGLLREVQPAFK